MIDWLKAWPGRFLGDTADGCRELFSKCKMIKSGLPCWALVFVMPCEPWQQLPEPGESSLKLVTQDLMSLLKTLIIEGDWNIFTSPETCFVVQIFQPLLTEFFLQTNVVVVSHGLGKSKFLYSTASIPEECSKYFTLYSLPDLFNQTPSRLLWEAFSHTAVNMRILFIH